jgi:hypothetical protein
MPHLNWDIFAALPGSAETNFEALCRALIRRHYGRYGDFAALAAQPGIEFHLKLHTECSLGKPGRWYGWQCRWYDLPGGRALGGARRAKIAKALATTAIVLPGLTDWVLWTRRPLTKGDQKWFKGLQTRMRLHLWTGAEVEEHLSGEAEILRSSYFGELILTPEIAVLLHQASVAPIQRRWQPFTHQTVDAERALRRMLGEHPAWHELQSLAARLEAGAAKLTSERRGLVEPLGEAADDLASVMGGLARSLTDVDVALGRGDLDILRQQLSNKPPNPNSRQLTLPRRLRGARHRAALTSTNGIADCHLAVRLLADVEGLLGNRLIGVVADAGCGKTQLGAQLTVAVDTRPAGILLHGRDLHAGQSLEDLAHRTVIQGTPVKSMEALVAAVDAAGQRARRRLPIVIDGLNEAEDPRDWKPALAALDEMLRRFPYVLVVCTVRPTFADEVFAGNVDRLSIPGFGRDRNEAIRRYFEYYRIDPADAEVPLGLLGHPLTLRLFCEVTNPKREKTVGIETMPGSLTALFDRYLKQAAERIAELAPPNRRYYEQDVRAAFDEIGSALWDDNTRSFDFADLRRRLDDTGRPWNESIVRALEHEGVLLRDPGEAQHGLRSVVVYDALAGHLIANAILAKHGRAGFEPWLRSPVTLAALGGPLADRHPLAEDVFGALVGLVPRRLQRQQLWPLLDPPLRIQSLRATADLEAAYLDAATVNELSSLIIHIPEGSRDLLDTLRRTRGASDHPLNADFLDATLRRMTVADLDARWSEWIRRHDQSVIDDLRRLAKRWRNDQTARRRSDRLRARWVMWTLSSTVRELRDQATNALYWFGRGDPRALFELTLDALSLNDTSVLERMLASSYGVAMAHQLPCPDDYARILKSFLVGLRDRLVGPSASHPTDHWLARLYVQGTVALAQNYHPSSVPEGITIGGIVPFAAGPVIAPIVKGDQRAAEADNTLNIDFANYTLGRLFGDRNNYDMGHREHQAAVDHVRGVVWDLGWRRAGLGAVDRSLDNHLSRHDRPKTERYGKKYGWIGYYTYAGILNDRQKLSVERLSDVDIDPSFPEPPRAAPFEVPKWALPTPRDERRWIRQGVVSVPDHLLYRSAIDSHTGPWIAVYGHLTADEQTPGRRVYGLLTALLVAPRDSDRLVSALASGIHPRSCRLPDPPEDHYTFAGEIPWHSEFARITRGSRAEDPYRQFVRLTQLVKIEVEELAHWYGWESYHSALNKAGGALVPSLAFSSHFDLRGLPQSFDQALSDGSLAACSLSGPPEFGGELLYLREDLLHRYADGRRLIWHVCGEREIRPYPQQPPDWLVRAQRSEADGWRKTVRAEELSSLFASRRRRKHSPYRQRVRTSYFAVKK